ncbi:PHP domain-containing protein [Crocosphaera sp. UHCC 0190]|uniref:PHP domain-containing protein n=1 Tax=Crocosphaera sp. UHCC 0190 TaxID=3110246 RepID=UPI002B215AC9|nr:PHP domain-containing protein [Crocosphaera sp. UHCC 0190]MEA5512038.1 PHP domain-containing protein [Crocosphaera sp. UHCC 0190]
MVVSISTKPSSQDTQTLKTVWSTLHAESCPYEYNFHMHTIYSDGKLTPEELIKQATDIGLKGMAITDHHSTKGYQIAQNWIKETSQQQPHQLFPHLWTGIEITSRLLDVEVHILGYGFTPEHPLMEPYQQGDSPTGTLALGSVVINAIQKAGGMAVLAHPERYSRSAKELIPLAATLGIDGVETFYAYGNSKPWKTSPKQTETVSSLSNLYGLYRTCGTDSHGVSLLQRI